MARDSFGSFAVFFLATAVACALSPILAPIPALADNAYLESLKQDAQAKKLAESIQWLNLGHYRKGIFGGMTSQVDGPLFFLSGDGKTSPDAELAATLDGFFSEKPYGTPGTDREQHPRCQFPARYRWLKRELNIDETKLPKVECKKLDDFLRNLSAKSATLVFSSFYINNPSSAFGHSLIRINSSRYSDTDGEHHELLDHGINFAAEVTTSNPVLYGVFGLIGVFKGTFTSVPYYYKVREYNDFESRDLWGYDLNLTDDEVAMLTDHFWELGWTYYDYFYFTENCAYHMFTSLDAAAPRLHLTERLPYYVIPSNTVQRLMEVPGLVSQIHYRPSARAQFDYRFKLLTEAERSALHDLVVSRSADLNGSSFSVESKARILDTLLDYLEFTFPGDIVKTDTLSSVWKQKVLVNRASLNVRSAKLVVPTPEDEAPHRGHGIRRATVAQGYERDRGAFTRLAYRFAMTDPLDPGPGYPKNGQIEFMNLQARYQPRGREFVFEDATLFKVLSVSPMTTYRKNLSFRAELGGRRIYDRNCRECFAGIFEGGFGPATNVPGIDALEAYGMLEGQFAYSGSFDFSAARVGVGPAGGLIWSPSLWFKAMASGSWKYLAFSREHSAYEFKFQGRYGLNKSWALNGSVAGEPLRREASLGLMYYF